MCTIKSVTIQCIRYTQRGSRSKSVVFKICLRANSSAPDSIAKAACNSSSSSPPIPKSSSLSAARSFLLATV
ncbi:unnamed protein product [Schistosoma curassoni]|uniref:Uncharacterized protein n=2 Tax=Schistosoma TaxID=6181 RepID=A0A183K2Q6_9TREM|nr:unnamed protein product [Schistosoma margrebowiei]VDP34912.1 unnamed protein product [Schistosoma curassoni]